MYRKYLEKKIKKLIKKQKAQQAQISELAEVINNNADVVNNLIDSNVPITMVFEKEDMLSFAEYVLSEERQQRILSEPADGTSTRSRLRRVNRNELSEWIKKNLE